MRFLAQSIAALLAVGAPSVLAASGWGFSDATLTLQSKGSGASGNVKEKLSAGTALSKTLDLGPQDTLKIVLTAQDGKTAKRPHQAFLNLLDPASGLETSFPFEVKESGKGKIELTQKDVPLSLIQAAEPLAGSIMIASFGSSQPYHGPAFTVSVKPDPNAAPVAADKPLRYGKLPEIHHIFNAGPKNPPIVISLFFTAGVLVALPALLGSWLFLGANANHLSTAMSDAPVAHAAFYGSIVAMEGVFFMYYTSWNLFKVLPVALGIGAVIFVSGSRALTEVQQRRLAGKR